MSSQAIPTNTTESPTSSASGLKGDLECRIHEMATATGLAADYSINFGDTRPELNWLFDRLSRDAKELVAAFNDWHEADRGERDAAEVTGTA